MNSKDIIAVALIIIILIVVGYFVYQIVTTKIFWIVVGLIAASGLLYAFLKNEK